MKQLLPLSVLALMLAGCADDNATNPWSTKEEVLSNQADKAATKHKEESAKREARAAAPKAIAKPNISFLNENADAPKTDEAVKPLEANHARIIAVRADAGLIQFKRAESTNPGDKLVLTKDGASLLVVASIVEGESVIADIAPRQVKTPAILVGDDVVCTVPVEDKPEGAAAPAAPAHAAPAPAAAQ